MPTEIRPAFDPSLLLNAVRRRSVAAVRDLLDQDGLRFLAQEAQSDNLVDGLVMTAVDHGRVAVLDLLLNAGGHPDQVGRLSQDGSRPSWATPLMMAIRRDEMVLVDRLLADPRTQVNRLVDGQGPMHLAAALGQMTMVERLLNAGADPDLVDLSSNRRFPYRAVERACEQGHAAVVERLIDASLDPRITLQRPSLVDGHPTLLMLAAWYGHADLTRFLLDQGASLHAVDARGQSVLARTAMQVTQRMTPSVDRSKAVMAILTGWERALLEQALPPAGTAPAESSVISPRVRL